VYVSLASVLIVVAGLIGTVIEFGYHGEGAWLDGSLQNMERAEAELFTRMAIVESSLTHLAWSYRSSEALEYGLDAVLELLPAEVWQGRTCAVVLSHGILPVPMYHYIDVNTYREVHRRANLIGKDGATVEVGIDFDPPDGRSPYGFPMGYQLFVDGQLHDAIKYSKVKVNRVILSSLFAPSADCFFTSLGTRP